MSNDTSPRSNEKDLYLVRRPPLDIASAAAYLGTTTRHMRRLVAERRIPYLKIAGSKLRFLPDDLDAWLMEQRIQAVP